MTQTEATQSRSPSQFNTDRTYPDRWTITFNNPPRGNSRNFSPPNFGRHSKHCVRHDQGGGARVGAVSRQSLKNTSEFFFKVFLLEEHWASLPYAPLSPKMTSRADFGFAVEPSQARLLANSI